MSILTLLQKYKKRLSSSTFRQYNTLMCKNEIINDIDIKTYHEGYNEQMVKWECRPVDVVLEYLKGIESKESSKGSSKGSSKESEEIEEGSEEIESEESNESKGNKNNEEIKKIKSNESKIKNNKNTKNNENKNSFKKIHRLKIADIGCGEALLSNTLKTHTFYNYDLYPLNPTIIKAHLNHIPQKNTFFNILIYSLSLMTNNLKQPLKECNRILKNNGLVIISELKSRIELKYLVKKMVLYGFGVERILMESEYFFVCVFVKKGGVLKEEDVVIGTSEYKKR